MVDSVVYADLSIPKAGLAQPSQAYCSPPCPRWHDVALKVGGAGYIALLAVIVVLSVTVLQSPTKAKFETSPEVEMTSQISRNRSDNSSSWDRLMLYLKQHVCEPEHRTSTENLVYPSRESQCLLCPKDWLFHGGKCYKFFGGIQKDWNESKGNCSQSHAHLLVIQDQEEKAFVKNIVKSKNDFWIGLQFNSWKKGWFWVDDTPLPRRMWPESSLSEDQLDSCGTFKENRITSDSCKTRLPWVCQMKAFMI